MITLDIEQGSPQWHAARIGVVTASHFKEIITPVKGTRSSSANAYLYTLLSERITGEPTESFSSEWMQRGSELESAARSAYEFLNDTTVVQVGIILNDARTIGASPDGLIGTEGGIEIKCPKPSTMMRYMIEDKLPDIYKPQVQGNLWLSNRQWWDFVAYHPSIGIFQKRIERDEDYIANMQKHIEAFVKELESQYHLIKGALHV
jgi:putative phage-type endonuclease